VNAPLGYIAIPFTQQLNTASLTRYSVRLIPQKGGLSNTAFDSADQPLNALVTYNPNTRTLIVVPTVPVGADSYWLVIGALKAANGGSLKNPNPNGGVPIVIAFTVKTGVNAVGHAMTASRTALETRVASALPSGPSLAIVPQPQTSATPAPAPAAVPSGPQPTRPLQAIADPILGNLSQWLLRPRLRRGWPAITPRWPAGPFYRSE
jgi:hypothetical protein